MCIKLIKLHLHNNNCVVNFSLLYVHVSHFISNIYTPKGIVIYILLLEHVPQSQICSTDAVFL